jgi:hypothetical protein
VQQWDLIKIDAEIASGSLIVRGTLGRLEPSWLLWGGIVFLDTDANSSTGTPVDNHLYGGVTIGADYQVAISTRNLGVYVGREAYLVKPGGSMEGHDSWINFKYSNASQLKSPASFTATIPLAAIGSPKGKVRLYIATLGNLGNVLSDIGPRQPLIIDLSQSQ